MDVRTKIILGFSVPVLMFFAFGLWIAIVMDGASSQLRQVREESVAFALMAKDMEMNVTQVQQYLTDIAATRAQDGLDNGFRDAETNYEKFNVDLAKFEQFYISKRDTKYVEICRRIRTDFEAFYLNGTRMAQAYISGGPVLGNRLMLDFDRASLVLQGSLRPFIKAQLGEMDAAIKKAESDARKARIVGLMLGVLAAGLSIFVARTTVNTFSQYRIRRRQAESALELARGELNEKNLILMDEKELLEDIVTNMRSGNPLDDPHIRSVQSSLERTTGDIALSAHRPDGAQHVLVGDFSGHGLQAAFGNLLVPYIFNRLTAEGCSMRVILEEVNRVLYRQLPPQLYMAACALELSPSRKQVMAWNCGMPPVLRVSAAQGIKRISSAGLPLGISETIDSFASHAQVDVESDTRIYLYSDGLTEAMSFERGLYGQDQLEAQISRIFRNQLPLEVIWQELGAYCGEKGLSDDAVLVEVSP